MSAEAFDCQGAWLNVDGAGCKLPLTPKINGLIPLKSIAKWKWTRTTHQAQNNIYFSLNTIDDKSAAGWGDAVGDTASRSNPTVKTQAFFDNHSIFDRGQCCPATSETSRDKKVWILPHLCAFLVWCVIHCIHVNMPTIVISSAAPHDIAATEMGKKEFKIQVTENRNLLLLGVFPQSRRFCIISYKSPIQTELMEYTLKQPPPPWPLNSHANKIYKYKEKEICTIHSMAGMGCWNISKVSPECEICNYWLYLLCGVKFAMLTSDTEKKRKSKSTGNTFDYTRGKFDSGEAVGCANLLRQVSFKFCHTIKEKKKEATWEI